VAFPIHHSPPNPIIFGLPRVTTLIKILQDRIAGILTQIKRRAAQTDFVARMIVLNERSELKVICEAKFMFYSGPAARRSVSITPGG
jgi:hypothetical protein